MRHDEAMNRDALLDRISIDPVVCGGRPCVRGHRIWVSVVLGMLADGMTIDEIVVEYPGLEADDVRACAAYGSLLAAGRYVDLPASA